jgi:hypothetical protein
MTASKMYLEIKGTDVYKLQRIPGRTLLQQVKTYGRMDKWFVHVAPMLFRFQSGRSHPILNLLTFTFPKGCIRHNFQQSFGIMYVSYGV